MHTTTQTMTPLQRHCWALAGALDARLATSRLHSLRVSFEALPGRPWWHLAALSDASGWEVQAGRWVVSLDRPRWLS
jgi:hypothetical protein